uniref:Peptidase C14 caspase domain-containing protein n=1 Tax=Moniliophthora roreri TaxID=221103 RepID=A0A0W0F8H4_MONRR
MVYVKRQSKELTRRVATRVNSLTQYQPIPIRKRALLIGIRYGKGDERDDVLTGPHSDVDEWKKLLVGSYGYREEDVIVMKDTEAEIGSRLYPNHANITRVLADEFILKNKENVSYFFLYSGHSGQTDCHDGTEEDDKNELIIPVDAIDDSERTILDDDLKKALVTCLPPRCKLVAVLDTCHSGTLMDLDHHRCNRVVRLSSNVRRVQRKFRETRSRVAGLLPNGSTLTLAEVLQCANQVGTAFAPRTFKVKTCSGLCLRSRTYRPDVLCISACRDGEQAWEDLRKDGASVARAMLKYLKHDPTPTYKDLMRNIADSLQSQNIERKNDEKESNGERKDNKGNKQNPELSSEVPLHMSDRLYL